LIILILTALLNSLITTRAFPSYPGSTGKRFTEFSGSNISKSSQEAGEQWQATTSVFLEVLGKGFYSVNLDFRKRKSDAFSVGIQIVDVIMPTAMYYRFFGARSRLETGAGVSGVFSSDEGVAGMALHGVIGYRYQKKKGLLFRIGFTPFFGIPFLEEGNYRFVPLGGISLGYCF